MQGLQMRMPEGQGARMEESRNFVLESRCDLVRFIVGIMMSMIMRRKRARLR